MEASVVVRGDASGVYRCQGGGKAGRGYRCRARGHFAGEGGGTGSRLAMAHWTEVTWRREEGWERN